MKIICVVGPTASGKTNFSIELARKIGGEIICGDSMQIYKYFDIGTAKPTKDEMMQVPHHLFDFVDPLDDFSVAKYVKTADKAILDIQNRGKIPIITGGTGLYIDSLVRGNDFAKNNVENENLRAKLFAIAYEKGNEYLHNMLKDIDMESYKKLHFNDVKRVVRALEVYKSTGNTISEHNQITKKIPNKYNALYFGLNERNREVLYKRIDDRVDKMMKIGLLDEVRHLKTSGKLKNTSSQAIGYKELLPYLDGKRTIEECIEKIKMESRRYAKRQLTWFRRNKNIFWLYDVLDNEKTLNQALQIIKEEFYG